MKTHSNSTSFAPRSAIAALLCKHGSLKQRHSRRAQPIAASAADAAGDTPSREYAVVPNKPAVLAAVVATLGSFCFGYHLSVLNGPLAAVAAEFGFAGQPALQGLVVSSCLAGAAFGSLSGATLAERAGRRGTLLLTAVPLALGSALCASATSLNMIIAGRVLTGVGMGLASGLVPMFISEVAPPSIRGVLGAMHQLVLCLGILGALLVNVAYPPTNWRPSFWIATVPAALLGLGMLVMPESPRWLWAKNRLDDAQSAAAKLWGPSGPALLNEGQSGLEGSAVAHAKKAPSLVQLAVTKSVIISSLVFVFQQFSGINAIIYYSSSVFAQAGVQSQALASAAVGAVNVLGTIVAGSLIDNAGRKQLLLTSFLGMAASMLAICAALLLPQLAGISGPLQVAGTIAYVLSFAIGVGPVPAILLSELNSNAIRGAAVAFVMVIHWICNFAIGQLFLPTVARFGVPAVYLGFATVCVAAAVFTSTSVLETKGRTLEEIEQAMA